MNRRNAPSFFLAFTVTFVAQGVVFGHELRPAYLDLKEAPAGEYSVIWKTPVRSDLRLSLEPEFSGDVTMLTEVSTRVRAGAAIQEWKLHAPALRGQTVRIRGLEGTMTDTVVRIAFADGSEWTGLLTPRATAISVPETPQPSGQDPPRGGAQPPVLPAIAAWGVVCAASALAQSRRNAAWRRARVGLAYAAGIAGVYFLLQCLAETAALR